MVAQICTFESREKSQVTATAFTALGAASNGTALGTSSNGTVGTFDVPELATMGSGLYGVSNRVPDHIDDAIFGAESTDQMIASGKFEPTWGDPFESGDEEYSELEYLLDYGKASRHKRNAVVPDNKGRFDELKRELDNIHGRKQSDYKGKFDELKKAEGRKPSEYKGKFDELRKEVVKERANRPVKRILTAGLLPNNHEVRLIAKEMLKVALSRRSLYRKWQLLQTNPSEFKYVIAAVGKRPEKYGLINDDIICLNKILLISDEGCVTPSDDEFKNLFPLHAYWRLVRCTRAYLAKRPVTIEGQMDQRAFAFGATYSHDAGQPLWIQLAKSPFHAHEAAILLEYMKGNNVDRGYQHSIEEYEQLFNGTLMDVGKRKSMAKELMKSKPSIVAKSAREKSA